MGLTEMELVLFERGKEASRAISAWKMYGTRRIAMSDSALILRNAGTSAGKINSEISGAKRSKSNTVSPDGVGVGVGRKRSRAY